MMERLLGACAALVLVSACAGTTDSTDQTQSALSSESTTGTDADAKAKLGECLTTYASCVRAGTGDQTCHDGLRACLPPPPRHPHGPRPPRAGDGGDGDGDGDHEGCKDGDRPPPPPPGADGGAPPPHRPPPCIGELDTCAKGTEAIATCVDAAVACFEAAKPPPPPPR